ncbi:hypothetical protein Pla110_24790 [Polystyrenella longa]|uniref:Chromosome partition protein Smc n=2 Tax=Polystyrenella longa TaxID=2528007 RepID=A0A518CNE4_9PLAN|nr:hypothetical protein Pla110_24790 [Polystyrenella longa]
MSAGKLSFALDHDGNKVIEASELIRAYGDACNFDREERKGAPATPKPNDVTDDSLATIKKMQEQLTRQYVSQIEHLQQALDKAQEGQNRVTLLLEQRTGETSDWQTSLETMSQKIAKQTQAQIEEIQTHHNKELNQLKRALHNERQKSVWKRLFG